MIPIILVSLIYGSLVIYLGYQYILGRMADRHV